MKFNTSNEVEKGQALDYLLTLMKDGKMVEIVKVSPKRSLNQNAYLHLLLGAFGNHFGYTLEEAKLIYKEISKDIYLYEKKGRKFWRSSANISKEDMAQSIDRFMEASKKHGYPLPPATDQGWLMAVENEIERAQYYLRGNTDGS